MKRVETWLLSLLCLPLVVVCGVTALGQAPKAEAPTAAKVFQGYLTNGEHEFVPAAEAMPEDKYSFAPSNGEFKGVRTFEEQVKHVAAVNYLFGSAILQEKPPVDINHEKGPDSVKSKAEIVKYLNDSFAYLNKALGSLTPENMLAPIKSPFGQGTITRLQIALIAEGHPWDHYGQMVEYLRMNGIVPPASRR
jgi:hypothetical protein